MKRRQFLSAVVAAPVAATVTSRPVNTDARQGRGGGAPAVPQAPPPLVPVPTASLSEPATAPLAPTFFTAEQFAALQKAADLLVPASGGNPSARDAAAPEFLDFYIGMSAANRQALYRKGLDDLNARARRSYRAPFGQLDDAQASAVLKPLFAPYAGKRSSLAFGPFVNEVRADLRTAATNSPAWAAAARAAGRPVPSGQYWRISTPTVVLHK